MKNDAEYEFRAIRNSNEYRCRAFLFNESWDHTRHYYALFNAQLDLLKPRKESGKRWAMIADWRNLLVQVPEGERLCVRSLQEFTNFGLSFYAPVSGELALAKWQVEQVTKSLPELPIRIFQNFESSVEQLKLEGFDTNFTTIPFDSNWLRPTPQFSQRVCDLGIDPTKFATSSPEY